MPTNGIAVDQQVGRVENGVGRGHTGASTSVVPAGILCVGASIELPQREICAWALRGEVAVAQTPTAAQHDTGSSGRG